MWDTEVGKGLVIVLTIGTNSTNHHETVQSEHCRTSDAHGVQRFPIHCHHIMQVSFLLP